jgi:hypothetical protein
MLMLLFDTSMFFLLFLQVHGINSIKNYMQGITRKAKLDTHMELTNISARKHMIGTCRKSAVPDGTTMKVSHLVWIKLIPVWCQTILLKCFYFLFWHFQINFISGNSLL